MIRSPASWCGLAPFGPEPTTVKSTCSWPNSRSRPARSAATSVSLRPANRTSRISLVRRVRGGARGRQPGELVGVLDRPQHRQAVGQRPVRRAGQRALEARAGAWPRRSRRCRTTRRAQQGRRPPRTGPCRRPSPPVSPPPRPRPPRRRAVRAPGRAAGRLVGSEHEHRQPLGDRGRAGSRSATPGPARESPGPRRAQQSVALSTTRCIRWR